MKRERQLGGLKQFESVSQKTDERDTKHELAKERQHAGGVEKVPQFSGEADRRHRAENCTKLRKDIPMNSWESDKAAYAVSVRSKPVQIRSMVGGVAPI